MQHWIGALNHFDAFYEECTKRRADVQLDLPAATPDPPFPVDSCLAVLAATTAILENCSNKQLWASHEVRCRRHGEGRSARAAMRIARLHQHSGSARLPAPSQQCQGVLREQLRAGLAVGCLTQRRCAPPNTLRPQHVSDLLAAPSPEVVDAALATLTAFLRISHGHRLRLTSGHVMTKRLLVMAHGWGGKAAVRASSARRPAGVQAQRRAAAAQD